MVGGKSFSRMDRDELSNAVDEKKALPDMILKRLYFNAQEQMCLCEQVLMNNYFRNGRFYNELDSIRFRGSILVLFRLISGMLLDAKVLTWRTSGFNVILAKNRVESDYELCLKLTNYAQLDVDTLIHLAGYLNFGLHQLGLTDLLMNEDIKEIDIKDLI